MLFKDKKKRAKLTAGIQQAALYILCFALILIALNLNTSFGLKFVSGDISTKTVYAPHDFSYPISIDQKLTKEKIDENIDKILPFYSFGRSVTAERFNFFHTFFEEISELIEYETQFSQNKINELLRQDEFEVSKTDIRALIASGLLPEINNALLRHVKAYTERPIVTARNKEKMLAKKSGSIYLIDDESQKSSIMKISDIVTEETIIEDLVNNLKNKFGDNEDIYEIIVKAAKFVIHENIIEDKKRYDDEVQLVKDSLRPVYEMGIVRKNEIIIEKGRLITEADIQKLNILYPSQFDRDLAGRIFGQTLVLLLLSVILILFLRLFGINFGKSPKNVFVSVLLMSAIIFSIKTLMIHQFSIALVPLSAFAMLVTLLIGVRVAFMMQLATAALSGLIEGIDPLIMFSLFAGACVSIYYVRTARRRAQILIPALIASVTNCIVYAAISNVYFFSKSTFSKEEFFFLFLNGLISAAITIVVMPIFEYLFKYCTNITLLELSDLNNALLRELTLKAPGTYHHSLVVGNLADAACEAIGANSLLARVGAYYHDIGKTVKPQYFTENEYGARSLHQKLAPTMSALIITNHVKDGIAIAKKHKIPQIVINFIPEHHGTSLIYYFYQRALSNVEEDEILSDQGFRYTGPKPRTRETAIVMLADSVEASSRTLKEPTPSQIKAHVNKIINMKFIDGQLNECDLTLKDINIIAESFIRIIAWSFHTRIEYPNMDEKGSVVKGQKENSK